MKSEREIKIALAVILGLALLSSMTNCRPSYGCPKPTNREINRAMRYSNWTYDAPEPRFTMGQTKSNFCFHQKGKK